MIREYRQIIGTPVLQQDDGSPLAVLNDIIIDPDSGKVMAFWVKPVNIPLSNAIIETDSILEWKKNIYIQDERQISDPADIIRISEVLERNTFFIGNRVQSEEGEKLGMVTNLTFDDRHFKLRQLMSHKIFLFFAYQPRLFDYRAVISVNPDYIVVKNKEEKKEEVKSGQPVMDI